MVELMGNEEANVEMNESCHPFTKTFSAQLWPCVKVGFRMPTRISLWRWSVAAVDGKIFDFVRVHDAETSVLVVSTMGASLVTLTSVPVDASASETVR